MISNYGKIALRNFIKNRTFVLINILSLSIGLACCIVSYLNYDHNTSFDEQHENVNKIYRINYSQQDGDYLRNYGVVPLPISNESSILANVSDVTRYSEWHRNVKKDDSYFNLNVGFVNDNFLDVFDFALKRGSKKALGNRAAIIISSEMAVRLFGEVDIIGQTLTYVHRGVEKSYVIEGVLDKIPTNSSFQIDALTHIDNLEIEQPNDLWNSFSTTFLVVNDNQSVSSIEEHLNEFAGNWSPVFRHEAQKQYYLDPLKGMASRAEANNVIGPLEVSLPWAMVLVPSVISALILLIACFTFTNTSIASASSRLKEIGMRKVMGGRKNQIIFQFLAESLVICLLAIIVAIPISSFLAIQYSQLLPFLDLELAISGNIGFFSFIFGLLLLTGLIAGSYPALYLSKFQPTQILKGNLKYKSVGRLTKILLTGQFAFAMLTITSSVMFIQNAQYQKDIDLGYDTEQTIVVRFGGEEHIYHALNNELANNPRITALTASVDHVGRRYHNATVSHRGETFGIVGLDVGPNYIQTIELELLQGRDFDENRASDYEESVIINEFFVKAQGWEDPIGKKLTYQDTINYYVIGVVKDFYFDAFNSPIQPLWLRFKKPDEYNYLIAKTDPLIAASVMEEIKGSWRDLFNSEISDIKPPDYPKNEGTAINSIILKVLVFMGSIAAVMSMIGFFSLVSLNLFGRMKEIGVRRVLGSSITNIIKVINKDYILILLVGIITGSLASHFLVPMLMGNIWAYHIDGNIILTLASILLMLLTCIITVGVRVVKAANTNPVYLLKDE